MAKINMMQGTQSLMQPSAENRLNEEPDRARYSNSVLS